MKRIVYREWRLPQPLLGHCWPSSAQWPAVAGLAALYMEHNGHWVTGMTNQVVWGTPHIFAIFLIVAASGALNVASIGTVFGARPTNRLGVCRAAWPWPC